MVVSCLLPLPLFPSIEVCVYGHSNNDLNHVPSTSVSPSTDIERVLKTAWLLPAALELAVCGCVY